MLSKSYKTKQSKFNKIILGQIYMLMTVKTYTITTIYCVKQINVRAHNKNQILLDVIDSKKFITFIVALIYLRVLGFQTINRCTIETRYYSMLICIIHQIYWQPTIELCLIHEYEDRGVLNAFCIKMFKVLQSNNHSTPKIISSRIT